ncbi:MAG: methionine adenosyltransferase [Bacilli bacterium]
MLKRNLFTSEQVSEGHPDKICDQISDAILDACLEVDKDSRVAVETLIKNYYIVVAGEITTKAKLEVEKIVKSVLTRINLKDVDKYQVTNYLFCQSPDIAMGVDTGGAGDQGIMFGYACNETKEGMPLAFSIATKALINLKDLNHPKLCPDAKSQVTIDYDKNRIDTFLISTQHLESVSLDEVKEIVTEVMIKTALEYNMNTDFKKLINPTGRFVIGGSHGDAGVTGRKIVADTYGGYAKCGGGAFSGKDPTKVDRSVAYMARHLAKDIVMKQKWADKCELQLSYAIGVKEPISININCFNTAKIKEDEIIDYVIKKYDLTPQGIITYLNLKNIKYIETTCYGHFGKNYLTWEKI